MTHGKNIPFLGTIHLSALSDIKIPQQVHQGAIMRAKKAIKITLLGLLVFVVIAVLGLLVWSSTSAYPARQVALSALNSSESVTVTQDQWITFTPFSMAEKGLIFYPGGLVEPAAYAPVLHRIAQEGVLVMIVPMPLNLAILNPGAANGVMDHYPSPPGSLPGIHWAVPRQRFSQIITRQKLMRLPCGILIRPTAPIYRSMSFQPFRYLAP
jgi:hypothetical protein